MSIANLPPLPSANTPLTNPDGTMNPAWYRFLVALIAALRA